MPWGGSLSALLLTAVSSEHHPPAISKLDQTAGVSRGTLLGTEEDLVRELQELQKNQRQIQSTQQKILARLDGISNALSNHPAGTAATAANAPLAAPITSEPGTYGGSEPGPNAIAVVGNGPLSAADVDEIQKCRKVWMFNDLKNLMVPEHRFTSWSIAEDTERGIVGLHSWLNEKDGLSIKDNIRKPIADRSMRYFAKPLGEKLNNKIGGPLEDIKLISGRKEFVDKFRKENPGFNVIWHRAHEALSKEEEFVTFGGCVKVSNTLSGCGPSSGTQTLDWLFAQRQKRGSKEWIHVYGMNWAFHPVLTSFCCDTNKTHYDELEKMGVPWEKKYAYACCDGCHNFHREADMIAKCCTDANRCKVHRTPNSFHSPVRGWGKGDIAKETAADAKDPEGQQYESKIRIHSYTRFKCTKNAKYKPKGKEKQPGYCDKCGDGPGDIARCEGFGAIYKTPAECTAADGEVDCSHGIRPDYRMVPD